MKIRTGSVTEAYELYQQLPEFADGTIDLDHMLRRLEDASALVLIAESQSRAIGFKVGYDRYGDGSFYSWLGGVLPADRGAGAAAALLEAQEQAVITAGYDRIYVQSRNRFVPMLKLLLDNQYSIVGVSLPDDLPLADGRVTFVKVLRS